jgi:hypothetical protein
MVRAYSALRLSTRLRGAGPIGDEIADGRDSYRIERVEEKTTRGGFHYAWAVLRE